MTSCETSSRTAWQKLTIRCLQRSVLVAINIGNMVLGNICISDILCKIFYLHIYLLGDCKAVGTIPCLTVSQTGNCTFNILLVVWELCCSCVTLDSPPHSVPRQGSQGCHRDARGRWGWGWGAGGMLWGTENPSSVIVSHSQLCWLSPSAGQKKKNPGENKMNLLLIISAQLGGAPGGNVMIHQGGT